MVISPVKVAPTPSLAASPAPSPAPAASAAQPLDTAVISTVAVPGASTQSIGDTLRNIGNSVAHAVGDTMAAGRLITYGLIYRGEKKLTENREKKFDPCDGMPTPQIDRPFVLVPGWTTEPGSFDSLVDLLTRNGANGGETYFVKQGQFYTMGADGQLQPLTTKPAQGRVFEMVWSDTHQSPNHNLPEMRQNLDAICQATGFDKVDAEGYSMGGIDTRLYLDQGGTQINRFMMLGTPNRGTRFGDLVADVLDRDVKWAANFAGISPADRESMDWLRTEKNSPIMQDLNSRAAQQMAKVPTISVGTDVMPTASPNWGLTWGDGLVPAQNLAPPGGDVLVLHEAMQHGRLNDDHNMQHVRAIFFGWGLPPNAAELYQSDADVISQVPHP